MITSIKLHKKLENLLGKGYESAKDTFGTATVCVGAGAYLFFQSVNPGFAYKVEDPVVKSNQQLIHKIVDLVKENGNKKMAVSIASIIEPTLDIGDVNSKVYLFHSLSTKIKQIQVN